MKFRVGLTYNVKSEFVLRPEDPPDLNAEFDNEETVNAIERALEAGGHEVIRLGNARHLLGRVGKLNVDIVFNIAEGYDGRNRESQVPILLEMLRIPFVGADGLTLGLTLDKVLTKKVFMAEGIPTPHHAEVRDADKLWEFDLTYPLIVKLRYEGSSKGLTDSSLVNTPAELRRQVTHLAEAYRGAAIFIEEFIEGSEFTVGIIGNESPDVLPTAQVTLDGLTDLGRKFYTFAYLRRGADYLIPAPIPDKLSKQLQDLALRAYQAVECRDFGRVDFRVDRKGKPYVLEINPLPSLSTEDVFNLVAKARGATYDQIINQILEAGLVRNGLKAPTEAGTLSARSR
ncbi:MAG: ATP-grasp domain-containing protein [Candidatus Omnitrophica bacterium]|nr:ATP-grasp domain-containing protein [Candidatus Omnitrophota bacterium]